MKIIKEILYWCIRIPLAIIILCVMMPLMVAVGIIIALEENNII